MTTIEIYVELKFKRAMEGVEKHTIFSKIPLIHVLGNAGTYSYNFVPNHTEIHC